MLSKSIISQIRLLHHKKYRDEQGTFLVEGVKSCLEVLNSDFEVDQGYITERFLKKTQHRNSLLLISENEMKRISCQTTAPEIICIVRKKQFQWLDFDETKPLLVLDAIRDPGNLGTIIRTADWFGFAQILCSEDCVDFTNPKVIQASMGSFTRTKIVYANLEDYLQTQLHRAIYGLYTVGEPLNKQEFANNDIVIVGSESHGISNKLAPYINKKIEIPIFPRKGYVPESLNAAMAIGIFMYVHNSEKQNTKKKCRKST